MTTFTIGPDEDDEQLVGPRAITRCVACTDGSWECVLSCGHMVVFMVKPRAMTLLGCSQCVDLLLARRRKQP
jgi:hypothetical protein